MEKIQTIYDMAVYWYLQIHGRKEAKYLTEYRQWKNRSKYQFLMKSFHELLYENMTIEHFLVEMKKIDEQDFKCMCIHLLFELDSVYQNKCQYSVFSQENCSIKDVAEINLYNHYSPTYLFVPLSKDNIILNSQAIKNANIRHHRIRAGVLESITSFTIIKSEDELSIKLYRYQSMSDIHSYINREKKMKIAIIPYSNMEWFRLQYHGEAFTVHYDKVKEGDYNIRLKQCLERLDAHGVNIVILPELAVNSSTVHDIQVYLRQAFLKNQFKNLKFIFMGSYWQLNENGEDGKNICYLLSVTGKLLLQNEKIEIAKIRDEHGKTFFESLGEHSGAIHLIDIVGWGRFHYSICKDALIIKRYVNIWNDYGVDFSIVSAYSNSLIDFINHAETFSKTYLGTTLVGNSCAARKMKDSDVEQNIGFLCLPAAEAIKHHAVSYMKDYCCNVGGQICKNCECAFIYELCLDEMEANTIGQGMKINDVQWHFSLHKLQK